MQYFSKSFHTTFNVLCLHCNENVLSAPRCGNRVNVRNTHLLLQVLVARSRNQAKTTIKQFNNGVFDVCQRKSFNFVCLSITWRQQKLIPLWQSVIDNRECNFPLSKFSPKSPLSTSSPFVVALTRSNKSVYFWFGHSPSCLYISFKLLLLIGLVCKGAYVGE